MVRRTPVTVLELVAASKDKDNWDHPAGGTIRLLEIKATLLTSLFCLPGLKSIFTVVSHNVGVIITDACFA